jgi:hypothetical protein
VSEKLKGPGLLREPFPDHQISILPKPYSKDSPKGNCRECGGYHGLPAVHLPYVGHAALTDRLLDADPEWTWEPVAFGPDGLPMLDKLGGLWIRLTVCGVTRLGYGDAQGKSGPNAVKEAIGDALRNAAMRFGAALDLWHKGDLHGTQEDGDRPAPAADDPVKAAKRRLWQIAQGQGLSAEHLATGFEEWTSGGKLADACAEDVDEYAAHLTAKAAS